jgi:hypothetical protein
MCKELPVILVNKGGGPEKNNRKKMEGRGGGEAQGVADPKKTIVGHTGFTTAQSCDWFLNMAPWHNFTPNFELGLSLLGQSPIPSIHNPLIIAFYLGVCSALTGVNVKNL